MKCKQHLKYFFIIFYIVYFTGCDIINPPETIPARIQLNAVDLRVVPGQGTARHKITEVWVYANSSLIGAFSPPVEIHYTTQDDSTEFVFKPGIRNNGILDDAVIYPMYTEYQVKLNTTPGAVSVVNPVIRYKPEAVFSLISDFETQNDFVDNRDTVTASMLSRSSIEPFEGNFSGEMIMTEEAHFIEVGNAIALGDLPTDGTPVYLELHYRSEAEMSIGLLGFPLTGQSFPFIIYLLRPSETWNKIYIELTDYLVDSDLPAYKILFRSLYPPGATEPALQIQLDNIKVVHL